MCRYKGIPYMSSIFRRLKYTIDTNLHLSSGGKKKRIKSAIQESLMGKHEIAYRLRDERQEIVFMVVLTHVVCLSTVNLVMDAPACL